MQTIYPRFRYNHKDSCLLLLPFGRKFCRIPPFTESTNFSRDGSSRALHLNFNDLQISNKSPALENTTWTTIPSFVTVRLWVDKFY